MAAQGTAVALSKDRGCEVTAKELRELDGWIAEHVMGMRKVTGESLISKTEVENWIGPDKDVHFEPPEYSTDPAAAMEVLKKCAEKGPVTIAQREDDFWIIDFPGMSYVSESSLSNAICQAAYRIFTGGAK